MVVQREMMPFGLCIMSMLLMQAGLAYSISVIHAIGAIHTSAYRLTVAAFVFSIVCAFKIPREIHRLFNTDTFLLGIAMGGMAVFFSIAIANMPLALATCIEFIGPMAVVCWYNRTTKSSVLVGGALLGIYLMLANTQEHGPAAHLWSAFAAAFCWAGYIVLGKRVSQGSSSMYGICPALVIAACTAMICSAWEPSPNLKITQAPQIFLITLLYPLAPYILDLLALKRLKHSTFGMLTSAEPVIALITGVITLGQTLTYFQMVGLSLVVFANAAIITERKRGRADQECP